MNSFRTCLSGRALLCALLLVFFSVQSAIVSAHMVPTQVLSKASGQSIDEVAINKFIQREQVSKILLNLGVAPENVAQRIARLTPVELQQLNQQIDELPAGGTGIVGAVVFVFLILIVLDLLGTTNIFPVIKPIEIPEQR